MEHAPCMREGRSRGGGALPCSSLRRTMGIGHQASKRVHARASVQAACLSLELRACSCRARPAPRALGPHGGHVQLQALMGPDWWRVRPFQCSGASPEGVPPGEARRPKRGACSAPPVGMPPGGGALNPDGGPPNLPSGAAGGLTVPALRPVCKQKGRRQLSKCRCKRQGVD